MLIQTDFGDLFWVTPEGQTLSLGREIKPLSEAAAHIIQYKIEDHLCYGKLDLLEEWTRSLISDKRIAALNSDSWEDRAPLYRQVNHLRDLLILFSKDTNNCERNSNAPRTG